MEPYAMKYEYLIRKAFKCGRHGVRGADADIFRGYEGRQAEYERGENKIESYEAGRKAGAVAAHLQNAISHVKKKHESSLTQEQYETLDNLGSQLYEPNLKNVQEVIDGTHEVFTQLGLSIG